MSAGGRKRENGSVEFERCARGCCKGPNAQANHYRSISAQPRAREVGGPRQRDEALAYDLSAYKAMRRQGLKPPKIDGAYDLARRATSEAEITLGQVIGDKDPARRRKGARLMENMLEVSAAMTEPLPAKGRGAKKIPMRARP